MSKPCPLYDMCIYKTAPCKVQYPDDGCVLYRWFKVLISKEKKESHIKGTKSKLTVADERAWDPGRPLTIDEAHNYYK